MSRYYDEAAIPDELRRDFNVYDRIRDVGLDLGTFEENVVSLSGRNIAWVVFHESGLVFLSGSTGGTYPMNDDEERIRHGRQGAEEVANTLIRRLHWALSCGGEGDLNDVLYTVKALGMVVSPSAGATSAAPPVTNGFSARWQSIFGGALSEFARDGVDAAGFSGVHARSALGGFDGRFSIEAEIIVAIAPALARDIVAARGWAFPPPPVMLSKVQSARGSCVGKLGWKRTLSPDVVPSNRG